MARGSSKRRQLVPESRKALDAMKYEIAAELGLPVGNGANAQNYGYEFAGELGDAAPAGSGAVFGQREDDWGHLSSRDAGAVGGRMTRELVRRAQQQFLL